MAVSKKAAYFTESEIYNKASFSDYYSKIPSAKSAAPTGVSSNYMQITNWHKMGPMAYKMDVYAGWDSTSVCRFVLDTATDSSGDYSVTTTGSYGKNVYEFRARIGAPHEFFLLKNNDVGVNQNKYALFCYGPDWHQVTAFAYTGIESLRPSLAFTGDATLPASYTVMFSTCSLPIGGPYTYTGVLATMPSYVGSINSSTTLTASSLTSISPDGLNTMTISTDNSGYTYFNAQGGSKTLILTSPRWNDLQMMPNVRLGTSGAPSMQTFYTIPASGSADPIVVEQMAFSGTSVNTLDFSGQTSHSWKPNTSMSPHIHWAVTTSMGTNTAVFQLAWQLREINDTYTTPISSNNYNEIIIIGPQTVTYQHKMSNFVTRTPTIAGLGNSSIIVGALARLATHTSDNFTGNIFLIGFDWHYQLDQIEGDNGPYP
jgi:hypothetical protein